MSVKRSNIKFNENICSGYRVAIMMDKQTETENVIGAFLQLLYANAQKIDKSASHMLSGFS
jgi:ABC-type Fe3+-citrate transport system substrate-binding protein